MEKKKYPIGAEHYTLYEEVGTGVSACVYRALCNSLNEVIAIKVLDFERDNCDLNNICREAQTMVLVDHPNVVKSHCSFVHDYNLWVVMPYMAGGSCLHILKAAYPDGFEEVVIATILREALKGLEYLHSQGHIHRDVKAGNILIDGRGCVKLGDFGVSACLFDSGDRRRQRNTFVGTPCWMAPEVMEQVNGYDFKADIWSFGITALELAHGHAPFSKYPPMKVLLMTLQNAPPGLDYERDKKFSKSFKQMIGSCLVKDPSRRPSAKKLLKHSFFKQARSTDYISRTLLEGLPDLPDRLQELKRKEEDMRAQKKMPDGQKEEISQNEYKRGISSWDFDLNDLKAQASLLQDEDLLSDKDVKGSTNSLLDLEGKQYQRQSSTVGQTQYQRQLSISTIHSGSADSSLQDDNIQWAQASSADTATSNNITRSVKSSDDVSVPGLMPENSFSHNGIRPENSFSHNGINVETNPVNKLEAEEAAEKPSDPLKTSSRQNEKSQSQTQSTSTNNGDIVNPKNNQVPPSETSLKPSKPTANGDEQDDKGKLQVVQQRGRFKVTSESVDFDKVPTCSILQKSHSMQVISQHPAITSPVMTVDSAPTHILNHSLYPTVQSLLQSNISQRECILNLMKQVSIGETAVDGVGTGTPMNTNIIEKSLLLEAGHDREKELLHEITDLQWRLICAQEELQKYKTENAQASI